MGMMLTTFPSAGASTSSSPRGPLPDRIPEEGDDPERDRQPNGTPSQRWNQARTARYEPCDRDERPAFGSDTHQPSPSSG